MDCSHDISRLGMMGTQALLTYCVAMAPTFWSGIQARVQHAASLEVSAD